MLRNLSNYNPDRVVIFASMLISLLRYERYKNENTWHNTTEQNKNYISNHILSLRSRLSACTAKVGMKCETKSQEQRWRALMKHTPLYSAYPVNQRAYTAYTPPLNHTLFLLTHHDSWVPYTRPCLRCSYTRTHEESRIKSKNEKWRSRMKTETKSEEEEWSTLPIPST